ncbi:hypothetical protein Y032_0355g3333 [Ancylostoma ceylanicum]|uniref:Uncharacterized protein n=1 Tax=Ancylostoma ceylanicum TaxID=53326 RepID=A0A016RWB8_9BILA|nr:hypothetical protein Y032_0355g3333 [Ancylostoma ceylanicum]
MVMVETLRSQLDEKDKEIEENREQIARLENARTAAEEINASLQETASSLSEQLNRVAAEKDELISVKNRAEEEVAEMTAKLNEIYQQLEESKNIRAPSNSGEVEQLKEDTEKLKQKIHEMESNHQRTVADITAMYENQSQFVEILTKKVEQFKQEKAEWITERRRCGAYLELDKMTLFHVKRNDIFKKQLHFLHGRSGSYESQIEVLKNEIAATTVVASNQSSFSQAQVDDLAYQLADLTKFKEGQSQPVNSLTMDVQHLESEKAEWTMEKGRYSSWFFVAIAVCLTDPRVTI